MLLCITVTYIAQIVDNSITGNDFWSDGQVIPLTDVALGVRDSVLAQKGEIIGNKYVVEFVRPLMAEDAFDNTIIDGKLTVAFAHGNTRDLQKHSDIPTIKYINFYTGQVSNPSDSKLKIVHGLAQFVSWAIIFPFGVAFARYTRNVKITTCGHPLWFYIHRLAQWLGFVLSVVAFILIFSQVQTHYATVWHAQLGTTALALLVFHIVLAMMRPKDKNEGEMKSLFRKTWEFQHTWTGRLAILMGLATIYGGLQVISDVVMIPHWVFYVYYGWLGLIAVILVGLEIYKFRYQNELSHDEYEIVKNYDEKMNKRYSQS